MSWHPGSHPLRHMHFEEGRLTRWNFPKFGYSIVRPSTWSCVKSEGHVAVSTETSRYISFSESLVRYVLSVPRFYSVYTLSDHSFAYSLYARVVGERERTKLVTIQLWGSDMEVLMFLAH